ncbi:thioredoxin-like protein [Neoconidiobolus thromboides FSU 785]|nr:thioredoxin-like protein [Neoconidiobolus thromboides FSU 785]
MSSHNLTLYSVGTPNGLKISVALALIGLDYKLHPISFAKNEQKEDWFISMNPNGRIPTVVDHQNKDFVIFESGAILLYLADRYDPEGILIAKDKDIKSQVEQWVMWQMGGLGPMLGQLGWFKRQEEKNEMAIKRYLDESMRLLGVSFYCIFSSM